MTTPTEDDIPSPNQDKGKKGIVIMKKIVQARSEGKKLEVSWNTKGQPIEPGGTNFISYLGSIVRANVPITYDDWKDSSLDAYKEIIWNNIQLTFNVDTCRKTFVLRKAGLLLRSFRTFLAHKYLKDDNGAYLENPPNEPPAKYASIISEDIWRQFIVKRMDKTFKEKSIQNKERASNSKYPYRGSRKGYARIEQDMVQLSQTNSEEMSNDHSNILSEALCLPEYPGRVRGMGFGVGHRDYFPSKKRPTYHEHDKLTAQVKDMSERMARMENELISLRKIGTPNTTEEANIDSGQRSCTLSSNSFPEGVSSCKLFTLSPSLCLVAHGKLHNFKSDTLHGRSLPKGHVKVSIDIALEPNVSLPIPIDDDDMMTIGQAIGTFVAWPMNFIQISDEDSTQPIKKKMNNTNECVAPKKKCQGKMTIQHTPRKLFHPNLSEWCNCLSSYMKLKPSESLPPIQIDKNIFGLQNHKEIINAEIIEEVTNYAWLGATTISIYIRNEANTFSSTPLKEDLGCSGYLFTFIGFILSYFHCNSSRFTMNMVN
ncbi:hypothetical protein VIGAN_08277400 [Vigna angularis var. angularis]|uniref:DUF8039 domain-containing protein n=1 Tax=Vigna angularis var. angularis TaxID=157739 RepID=A0A0S3SSW8_PHAAN|nr:hypothetical protein VIGAN_08277400 [Vigna angularis var. angularis]